MNKAILLMVAIGLLFACQPAQKHQQPTTPAGSQPAGKLFIIGGGKRPPALVDSLIKISGIREKGYIVILPLSSSQMDTSAYYASKQFTAAGLDNLVSFKYEQGDAIPPAQLDSVRNAQLVYLPGGNQNTFMGRVGNTALPEAIREAFRKGATIAGTSAGAALQSKHMLTGDERKYPEYDGDFPTIEANNIIIDKGLGLLPSAIIDQHFIQRSRMNRLLTAVIEHPGLLGIGIDESTAILVADGMAKVYGKAQVITVRNPNGKPRVANGYLGATGIGLNIYLPGDTFSVR